MYVTFHFHRYKERVPIRASNGVVLGGHLAAEAARVAEEKAAEAAKQRGLKEGAGAKKPELVGSDLDDEIERMLMRSRKDKLEAQNTLVRRAGGRGGERRRREEKERKGERRGKDYLVTVVYGLCRMLLCSV